MNIMESRAWKSWFCDHGAFLIHENMYMLCNRTFFFFFSKVYSLWFFCFSVQVVTFAILFNWLGTVVWTCFTMYQCRPNNDLVTLLKLNSKYRCGAQISLNRNLGQDEDVLWLARLSLVLLYLTIKEILPVIWVNVEKSHPFILIK